MKPQLSKLLVVVLSVLLVLALSELPVEVNAECINRVDPCDPNVSYFPNVPEFDYSSTVKSVIKNNTSVSLTLQIDSFGKMRHYLLVRCGCPTPKLDNPKTEIIHVPLGSILLSDLKSVSKFDKVLEHRQQLVNFSLYAPNSDRNEQMTLSSGAKIKLTNTFAFENESNPDVFITPWNTTFARQEPEVGRPRWPTLVDTELLETSDTNRAALTQLYGLLLGVEPQSLYNEATSRRDLKSLNTSPSSSPGLETWKILGICVIIMVISSIALVLAWKRWSRGLTSESRANDDESVLDTIPPQCHRFDNSDTSIVEQDPPAYVGAEVVQHVPPPYADIEFYID